MIKRILWVALAGAPAAALAAEQTPGPTEISYRSEAANFHASLRADAFSFGGAGGAHLTPIKPCNQQIVHAFWNDLVAHAQILAHDSARAAEPPRGGTLKLGPAEVGVGRFDSLYYYFNRAPRESVVVLAQGLQACHERLGANEPNPVFDREIRPLLVDRARARRARALQLAESRVEVLGRADFTPDVAARNAARFVGALVGSVDEALRPRLADLERTSVVTKVGPADADRLARDAARIKAKAGFAYLAFYLDETFARGEARMRVPARADRNVRDEFGHARATLTLIERAFVDRDVLARLNQAPGPFANPSERAARLDAERARVVAARAADDPAVDHCRTVYEWSHPVVRRLSAHDRAKGVPTRAVASSSDAADLKVRLKDQTAAIRERTRAWGALSADARANHAFVSLAWDAKDDVCDDLLP